MLRLFLGLVLLPCWGLVWAAGVFGQDAIRVQSNEVLVPTVVFDRVLFAQLNKMKPHHRDSYGHLVEKNEQLWDSIAVKGLTEKDFRLFEDGVEQKVQQVKREAPGFRVVNDNLGKHPELVGSGGGLWAYPDIPRNDMSTWLAWPQYVLAFVPEKSAPGSCHQIRVEVERKNTTVWARSEYCNTEHPASDPLSGTDFGKRMEDKAKPETQSDLDLKMKVWSFADNVDAGRVHVALEFPGQVLVHEFRDGRLQATIGTLVMVYKKNGTLAARFSDFACCDYGNEDKKPTTQQTSENQVEVEPTSRSGTDPAPAGVLIPDRYETQFALPPGEYKVRAVLSDGFHFGVQDVPLTVLPYDASKLGISDVVLSRRARKEPEAGKEKVVSETYTAMVSKGVEFTPTANTAFWPNDVMFAYFEINDPLVGGQPGAKVQVNMKIVDARSGADADTFAPVDTTTYAKAGNPTIAVARGVVLKKLTPGEYRLEVQASSADGKSTGWRAADFLVMEAGPLEMGGGRDDLSVLSQGKNGTGGLHKPEPEKKQQVIVNLSALDSSGKPVANLTSADLQILAEGKPLEITSIQGSFPERGSGTRGLPIVILWDVMNTGWPAREYIANRIIKVLSPLEADEGIYLYLLTTNGDLNPVGRHRTGQAAAVEQGTIAGGGNTEKTDEGVWTKDVRQLLMEAMKETHGFQREDPELESWRAPQTFRRMSEVQDEFFSVRGPKTLLWISNGVASDVPSYCEDDVISSATGTYTSGVCSQSCQLPNTAGMSDILRTCMDFTPFLLHFSAEAAATDMTVSSVALSATGLQDFEVGKAANTMARLADLTGGQIYMNTDGDVEKAIRAAMETRTSRYRLTFAAPVLDGKYHKLQVTCRRANVRIVAPRGYYAPEKTTVGTPETGN